MAVKRQRSATASRAVSGWRLPFRCSWRMLVFPAGVFAVHQLCYLLAYGTDAGSELSAHGDSYVAVGAVVAVALAAIALGLGLLKLVGALREAEQPPLTGLPGWLLWLGTTLALLAGFCALEGFEIVFEAHHAGGIVGIFGQGGWWGLPAAAFVAALLTLLVRGGRVLLVIVARRRLARRAGYASPSRPWVVWGVSLHAPLASCAAGRAPPARGLA